MYPHPLYRTAKNRHHNTKRPNPQRLTLKQPFLILPRPQINNPTLPFTTNKINKINRIIEIKAFKESKQKFIFFNECWLKIRINWFEICVCTHPCFTCYLTCCHVSEKSFFYYTWSTHYCCCFCFELFLEKVCHVFVRVDHCIICAWSAMDDIQC